MALEEYLDFLAARLAEMHRVLTPRGSLYVHLDHHAVHHVRMLLDEIFGPERFLNEIIWAYDYGGRARDRWPRKHDNILWYARSATWVFNREAVDRIPYMAPGLVGPEKAARGKLPTDVWWMTIVPTNGHERTGYPPRSRSGCWSGSCALRAIPVTWSPTSSAGRERRRWRRPAWGGGTSSWTAIPRRSGSRRHGSPSWAAEVAGVGGAASTSLPRRGCHHGIGSPHGGLIGLTWGRMVSTGSWVV